MGSAFDVEPLGRWLARLGGVMFSLGDNSPNPVVCHIANTKCPTETPHRMHSCGMFDVPTSTTLSPEVWNHARTAFVSNAASRTGR